MNKEKIQKCIDLLNTDGINSKEQVKKILQGELEASLLCNEKQYEPKDVMFSCCILDTDKFTPKMRKQCLYKIGKRIVQDSLLGLKFRVTPLNLSEQLPPDIRGIRVQARFKYVMEDVLRK